MALGPGSNNFLLGVLLATLVALGVLAYLYYVRTRLVAKIDLPASPARSPKKA
jgi:hypothetical protein